MIKTIEELACVIGELERKIEKTQYELSEAKLYKIVPEIKQLEEKERIVIREIQQHIKLFRSTISDNHIALKLFSNRLDILEKKYQLQPQVLDASIYCLTILKDKHAVLKQDQLFFLKMEQPQEVYMCNLEMQMIEIESQAILKEFYTKRSQNPDIKLNEETKLQFISILQYYQWDFAIVKVVLEKRKDELEHLLKELSFKLKAIIVKSNYRRANEIVEEIKQLEQELFEIKVIISRNIDSIS